MVKDGIKTKIDVYSILARELSSFSDNFKVRSVDRDYAAPR